MDFEGQGGLICTQKYIALSINKSLRDFSMKKPLDHWEKMEDQSLHARGERLLFRWCHIRARSLVTYEPELLHHQLWVFHLRKYSRLALKI